MASLTPTIPTFNLQHAGIAARQLQEAADTDERSQQINKAYVLLAKARWQFNGKQLVIESATCKPGTKRYRVTDGVCHCPGWMARSQCWHADAWMLLITAMQLAATPAPTPRPQRPMAELQADVDEIYN